HNVDQHLVVADRPRRQYFELHGGFRRAMTLLADRPGMHPSRHVAERRYFADLVKILVHRLRQLRFRYGGHGSLRNVPSWTNLQQCMLQRNINARWRGAGPRAPAWSTAVPAVLTVSLTSATLSKLHPKLHTKLHRKMAAGTLVPGREGRTSWLE